MIGNPKAFIFDLDGTIYIGDKRIEGADKVLESIRKTNLPIRFVTNNPRFSREVYTEKLNNMGVQADIEEIITSSWLTANYLNKKPLYGKIFAIGEKQLISELKEMNINLVRVGGEDPDTILVSFDTTLTYEKLQFAYYHLTNGANFIATNPDMICPTLEGGLLDAGVIISALESATDRKVEQIIGKPSSLLGKLLVDNLGVSAKECVIIGDRLNTDISLGKKTGMKTVWINSSNIKHPKDTENIPDLTINKIEDLLEWLPFE